MPRGRLPKSLDDYPTPVRDLESGCLLWQGPLSRNGYGRIGRKYVHVLAFERTYGPVPSGHQVDHVLTLGCVHRHCIEPSHLEAVTQRENILRQPNVIEQMARTHCPQNHPYDEENTVVRRGKRECRQCNRDRVRRWKAARR